MARDFDGTDDWLNFADTGGNNWDAVNPCTFFAWIRPDVVVTNVVEIMSQDLISGGTSGWIFEKQNDEPRMIRRGNTPTSVTGINLVAGDWAVLCVRCVTNGANTDEAHVKFTVTGTKTNVSVSDNFNTWGVGDRLAVGAIITGSSPHASFDGGIAHAAFWMGHELSDDEVWAFALGGPKAIGKIPDFYCPLWGVADPDAQLGSTYGGSGSVNGSASRIDGLVPSGPYAPLPGDAGVA